MAIIIAGERIGTLAMLVQGYSVSTNRCEAPHPQCEVRARIKGWHAQHLAPGFINDSTADHPHRHAHLAQAFGRHPAEILGEDHECAFPCP